LTERKIDDDDDEWSSGDEILGGGDTGRNDMTDNTG
jgi:hypothetical protein